MKQVEAENIKEVIKFKNSMEYLCKYIIDADYYMRRLQLEDIQTSIDYAIKNLHRSMTFLDTKSNIEIINRYPVLSKVYHPLKELYDTDFKHLKPKILN